MDHWTQEHRENITKRLQERGVNRPCPRCGGTQFSLIDGYAVFGMVDRLEDEGVQNLIPSVCVACTKCGYLTWHALGPLGLMPEQPPGEQPQPGGTQAPADHDPPPNPVA
jgi:hypothetical protein